MSKFVFDMVHHNPGEPKTKSEFLNPERLKDFGYNGQVLFTHVQGAITFDSFDKEIFPEGSEERQWVDGKAEEFGQALAKAKAAGLMFIPFTDFIVFPAKLMEKYRAEIACEGDEGGDYAIHGDVKPDIHKELTQKLVRVLVDEVFDRFPDMDGLMVRVGETYLHDMPYHSGGNPISRGVESHVLLINILREEVCEKRGKHLFYRTWLSGIDTSVEQYLSVTDKVEPHEKLIFCVKHCIGDFHRTNPFSQVLGVGRHQQLVEVQCQREYEGKGAHPNYIAQGVIDGFEEYEFVMKPEEKKCLRDIVESPNYVGTWTWSRGGGWKGPYIKNEFWCELNAFVMANWARDPKRSEDDIFNEFARKYGFDAEDANILREIAILSAQGVVRGHSSVKGGINVWWTRDFYIGGIGQLCDSFKKIAQAERVEEILSEKLEAVKIWKRIEELAGRLNHQDAELLRHIRVSASYGKFKYSVFANLWIVLLLEHVGMGTDERVRKAIADYDLAWCGWKKLEEENSDICATIYRNHFCEFRGKAGMHPASGAEDSIKECR